MDYKTKAMPLFEAGFEPIPLKGKRPTQTNWPGIAIDTVSIAQLAANGAAKGNVGIRCTETVQFLDVDVSAPDAVKRVYEWVRTTLCDGEKTPLRVGNWPKFGMPCRIDGLTGKARSTVYVDDAGNEQKIEVLTVGQQFVAYGIHPETGKHYEWQHGTPEEMGAANLPRWAEIDVCGGLFDFFDELALEYGWVEKYAQSAAEARERPVALFDDGDHGAAALARYKGPSVCVEELREAVFCLPMAACDDRDHWVIIGAAIHFETRGSEEGYRLFDAWSRLSAKYKDEKDTRGRWNSYRLDRHGDELAGFGTIKEYLKDVPDVPNVPYVPPVPPCPSGVPNNVPNNVPEEKAQYGDITAKVWAYILESDGEVSNSMLYQDFNLRTAREKDSYRKILQRLCEQGKLEKVPMKRGSYSLVETNLDQIDLDGGEETPFPLVLPFDLHHKINVLEGSVVVVSGTTNAGKTSFVFQVMEGVLDQFGTFKMGHPRSRELRSLPGGREENAQFTQKQLELINQEKPIRYLNSEMSAGEIKARLRLLGQSGATLKDRVEWVNRSRDWARAIDPDKINVVDYLQVYDDFYQVGQFISDIHQRLGHGIAIVVIQKKTGEANPRGGEFALERSRLAITLEANPPYGGVCTLRKVKSPVDYMRNPQGMQIDYAVGEGARLVAKSGLRYVSKAERREINRLYEKEQKIEESGADFFQFKS